MVRTHLRWVGWENNAVAFLVLLNLELLVTILALDRNNLLGIEAWRNAVLNMEEFPNVCV